SRNDPLHPGFLRLIHRIIEVAHHAGRRVTVCGEMAADPEGIVALAALGVDSVSVPVNQLAAARRSLAECSARELPELGPALLALRCAGEARDLLQQELVGVGEVPDL